jgi:solute carrier family 13 (sodium-dependent dicarboxylate transporter), member 2/3/5
VASQDLEARFERGLKTVGLLLGPTLGVAIYLANPGGHPPEARRFLGILALTIVWWITEAIPLPSTSLVSSALVIAAGVAPARQVLAPYADPIIFLFLGMFLLAEAVSRYGLDVRLASMLLRSRVFKPTGFGRMAAFGTAAAAISTCLSNTATAALMTPIALGALGDESKEPGAGPPRRVDTGVLLMIAYGASIGGMATIIGTPPNLLVVGFLERLAGVRVSFTGWLGFALPISLTLLFVSLVLTRLTLGRALASEPVRELTSFAPPSDSDDAWRETQAGARWTIVAFTLALGLWLAPSLVQGAFGRESSASAALTKHFPEAGVALLCAALLFVAPVNLRKRRFALTWADGQRVNWGVLMLFGGGLSLGTLGETTGIARWAGEGVVHFGLAASPETFMFVCVVAAITVSEFASNTASASLLVPIVIAAAKQAGFDPVAPAVATGLAATCGFIFPVSTPPNAIVFGTGRVPLTRMIRAGAVLDLACIVVVWAGVLLLRPLLPHAG